MDCTRFNTIEKCDKEIVKLEQQLRQLHAHKRSICEHDIIKLEGFVDDDYAQSCNQLWTHYLTCEQCGLQGRSEENFVTHYSQKKVTKDGNYQWLETLYDRIDWQNKQYVYDKDRSHSWQIAYRKGKPNAKST